MNSSVMFKIFFAGLLIVWIGVVCLWPSHPVLEGTRGLKSTPSLPHVMSKIQNMPLFFEENRGQVDSDVKFISRSGGHALLLTQESAIFHVYPNLTEHQSVSLAMRWRHASLPLGIQGIDPLYTKVNYFVGHPETWQQGIPTYAKVAYSEIYSGIDLIYYGTQETLEYDLIVAPGADPGQAILDFEGIDRIEIDEQGDLLVYAGDVYLRHQKPHVYQEINGIKSDISGNYVRLGDTSVGFKVGAYDSDQTLVIDPVVIYSTYLGGSKHDYSYGIASDAQGNSYVVGITYSINFPTKNALQTDPADDTSDVFVAKITPSGDALDFSTYLGGSLADEGAWIRLDASGNIYLTGTTRSTNFPLLNSLQSPGGADDIFITKLSNAGDEILYSSLLGGSGNDNPVAMVLDDQGNIYIGGNTSSLNYPTTPGVLQPTRGAGGARAVITKINPAGTSLVYSTYYGAYPNTNVYEIGIDPQGQAYITGYTDSDDLLMTSGAFDTSYADGFDAYIAKFNPTASGLIYASYLGGVGNDYGYGLAVDDSGNAYVIGRTNSDDFPIKDALQATRGGNDDAFITKFNPEGNALIFSSYLGGSGSEFGLDVELDPSGHIYLTGWTSSSNFPILSPFQNGWAGNRDAFLTILHPAGKPIVYSTYLGGALGDESHAVSVDDCGNAFLSGITYSRDFPTVSALQPQKGSTDSTYDGFITRFDIVLADEDNDGISASCDNCPEAPNSDQSDQDLDGLGDVCDCDLDNPNEPGEDGECAGCGGISNLTMRHGRFFLFLWTVPMFILRCSRGKS